MLCACPAQDDGPTDTPATDEPTGDTPSEDTEGTATSDTEAPQARPFSVQLHLHGPLSEGDGTHGAQDAQARLWGVDALWWTDHAAMYDLDRTSDPEWDELSSAAALPIQDDQKGLETSADQWWSFWRTSGAIFTYGLEDDASPDGAHRALALTVSNPDDGKTRWADATWKASRAALFRPLLANPVVRVSVWLPQDYDCEEHALRVVVPLSRLDVDVRVRLVVHDSCETIAVAESEDEDLPDDRSTIAIGSVLHPTTFTAGAWNPLELDLASLFVDSEYGLDLTAQGIIVQLGVRDDDALSVTVADVSLSHDGTAQDLVDRQVTLLEDFSDETLTHLVGQELSFEDATAFHHHLTAFTPEAISLISLEDLESEVDPRVPAAAAVLAKGGVTAFAHPFSTSLSVDTSLDAEATVAELCETLVETEAYGTQLLEAGYRERGLDLEAHLALWDCLGVGGVPLHGIGTNDLHNPVSWDAWSNNMITWVWAERTERTELIEALRGGRLFFGDPTFYDDVRLDLTVDGESVMGQTLEAPVTLVAALSGHDTRETARWIVDGEEVWSGPVTTLGSLTVPEGSAMARLELRDGTGDGVLFSNAVWFSAPDARRSRAP